MRPVAVELRTREVVLACIDAIEPERRPLFDRVHRLVLEVRPSAEVVLSYRMPTCVAGERRLHVGVWKHGLSFYGWQHCRDGGLVARHPDRPASATTSCGPSSPPS